MKANLFQTACDVARPWWSRPMWGGFAFFCLYFVFTSVLRSDLDAISLLAIPVAAALVVSLLKALTLVVRIPWATVSGGGDGSKSGQSS
jgi:hypothetical protein